MESGLLAYRNLRLRFRLQIDASRYHSPAVDWRVSGTWDQSSRHRKRSVGSCSARDRCRSLDTSGQCTRHPKPKLSPTRICSSSFALSAPFAASENESHCK